MDLKFDTKLGKLGHAVIFHAFKDGAPVEDKFEAVCFADMRSMMMCRDSYDNSSADALKFYPWLLEQDAFDLKYWAEYWVNVTMQIPFVKRRVLEFTGFTYDLHDRLKHSDVDEDKYVMIDFTVPVDEPFVVAQLFRIPQECPGNIQLFARLIEQGVSDLEAWIISLYFRDTRNEIIMDGHSACNGYNAEWWQKFLQDPSIAVSKANKFKSNVLGGSNINEEPGITVTEMLHQLQQADLPRHYVAVYGTLRKGMSNHFLLKGAIESGNAKWMDDTIITLPAKMYDTCHGFPAIVPSAELQKIKLEQYKVNDACLRELDSLEGYPDMYNRTQTLVYGQPTWIYYMPEADDNFIPIKGDWVNYARGKA